MYSTIRANLKVFARQVISRCRIEKMAFFEVMRKRIGDGPCTSASGDNYSIFEDG